MDAYLGKFSSAKRQELSDIFGCVWENDADATKCRSCRQAFGFSLWRHHCRCCGGLFCESCLQFAIELDEQVYSCCVSCNNCQTPGKSIKSLIKARKFADSEINGDTTVTPSSQATFIPLIQEEEYLRAHPDSTEQMHGYFEILNKSEVYICVKLFIGGDLFNEVPRPIFYPVGPNESLYAQFDKDVRQLNVIVLINNPHPIPMTRRVIVHKEGGRLPTSCCQVDKFEDFIVYKVPCSKKNVMLKYKDGKGLLVRDSKNLQRVTQSTMSKLMPASSMLTSLGLGGSKQQTTVQGSTVITSSPTNPGLNGNPRSPGRDTNIDKIELVFSSKQIDCSHDSVKLPGSGKAGSEGTATPRST